MGETQSKDMPPPPGPRAPLAPLCSSFLTPPPPNAPHS